MGSSCSQSDKQALNADIARLEAIARSEPLELLCVAPVKFKLQARKAHTVLEVLEMVAAAMQLPGKAGALLRMQFAEAIIAHHNTMHEAGLCDQAEFLVLGEDEARVQLMEAEGVTIHKAAEQGYIKIVRTLLLLAPESATAQNEYGSTPLHWAAARNKCRVAEALLAAGADVNAKDDIAGDTPLHWAALNNNNCEVAEALLAAGADVNAKNNYGITPLHFAVRNNKCGVAEALLAAGADLNAKDNNGETPLQMVHDFR